MIDNINKNNFYTDDEMEGREKYIPIFKQNLLKKIDDLNTKVKNEEPFPERNISLEDLCDIDEEIDNLLNKWYY